MIGDLKIEQYKKDLMGNELKYHLGDLNLLTVQEGSMAIFISYQINKNLLLNMIVTSEAIHVNMVNHLPINIKKITKFNYLFSKNDASNSGILIGSHIGSNYSSDSIKEILYTLKCSARERYVLTIRNSNNNVVMNIKNTGVELFFAKEPEISSEDIFGIFKEKIYTFNLVKNIESKPMIPSPKSSLVKESTKWAAPKPASKDEEDEYYGRKSVLKNKAKPESSNVKLLIFPFILFLIILFRTNDDTVQNTSTNESNHNQSQVTQYATSNPQISNNNQADYVQEVKKVNESPQIKKVVFEKVSINGEIYNIIYGNNGRLYIKPPQLNSTGYLVKVVLPNENGYRIIAMTPTNCNVFNKRMNAESNLNPTVYIDGQLQNVFDSGDGSNYIAIADYMCNYNIKAE